MEQQFGLARTAQSRVERLLLNHPWMRFFFTEDRSPRALGVIELQRRAVWIALALLCQSLVLIVHHLVYSC